MDYTKKYTFSIEKLKSYSIEKKLLSEKIINWGLLFVETEQTIKKYLTEVDYLAESDPYDCLPSDVYSQLLFEIISLWYPFYYDLERSVQLEIEQDIKRFF